MADVWDIAQYVEAHPDDYEQRWRLAKKLYLAWEYRLALEHLQVLKNEWEPRPNVRRYLGATLFRLQRYDDAIRELEDAVKQWPDDVPIRQQLARVLEAANKPKDAAQVWHDILEIEPDHDFGQTVLTKLKKPKQEKRERPRRSSAKMRAIAAPDARPRSELGQSEVVCQNCGARNGPEFSECWQCHGSLAYALPYEPRNEGIHHTPVQLRENPTPWVLFGLGVVGLLSAGLYLTLVEMFPAAPPPVGSRIPTSVAEFFFFDMMMTRFVGGIVLVIAWPVAFRIADYLLGLQTVDNRELAAAGVFLGALTYLVLWLPEPYPFYGLIAVPIVALVICTVIFTVRVHQGLLLWLVQGLIVLIVAGSVLAAFHGFDLIRDLPIVARIAQSPAQNTTFTWSTTVPNEIQIEVARSNSTWLNRHANRIVIHAETGPVTRRAFVELNGHGEVLAFEEMNEAGITFEYHQIEAGEPYTLIVSGEEGVAAKVEVRGMLPIREAGPRRAATPEPETVSEDAPAPEPAGRDVLDG